MRGFFICMEDIMTTDITVLESLMAIHLDVNIWTARKKLSPADFGGAELPPRIWHLWEARGFVILKT